MPLTRLLQLRPLVWIGVLSYALYLVHRLIQLLLEQHTDLTTWPQAGLSLVLADLLMSGLAFFIAYLVRLWTRGDEIGPFTNYLTPAAIQAVSTVLVFFFNKFYHRRHAALVLDEIYRLIGAVSIATLITVAFISFALRDTLEYQRSMMVMAWAASLITITLGRARDLDGVRVVIDTDRSACQPSQLAPDAAAHIERAAELLRLQVVAVGTLHVESLLPARVLLGVQALGVIAAFGAHGRQR